MPDKELKYDRRRKRLTLEGHAHAGEYLNEIWSAHCREYPQPPCPPTKRRLYPQGQRSDRVHHVSWA
jgi:hypothetical protein